MSNTLAIAAVTATLRDLLNRVAQPTGIDPNPDPDIADTTCTTKPPSQARGGEGQNQLNLFLYRTAASPTHRNQELPGRGRPLETALPPLALDLFYLVTAYGKNNDDLLAHRVLGRAMSLLHDRALLMPGEIDAALKNSDLGKQIERVRVSPQPLSTEELSRLWAIFQTPYRISASYQVSVVLIDSNRRTQAPLPVLTRGLVVNPSLVPTVPTLTELRLPLADQPAARLPFAGPPPALGDTVTFAGHDLTGTGVVARFAHPLLAAAIPRTATAATESSFQVALPDDQVNWPAGIYTVTATVQRATGDRQTNAVALTLAPRITAVTKALVAGVTTLTVKASPQVWPAQRASVVVGSSEFLAAAHPAKTETLTFPLPGLAPGSYRLRLRVDGVDSFLLRYDLSPVGFDPDPLLQVTIP